MTTSKEAVAVIVSHPSPTVSVIIPSLDGYRDGNVPKLVEQIRNAKFESLELLVVKGVSPNGKARDEGVRQAKGKYFIFFDDDVSIGSERIIQNLIEPFFEERKKIGITGASYLLPKDASRFQQKVAAQIPRVECPVVSVLTESDMVCHACLAVPAAIYREAGGESRTLVSGTDPDFKARIRARGYRVALVPNTLVYMPTFENLSLFCKKAFFGGKNSAFVQRLTPNQVHMTSETLSQKIENRPLAKRILFSIQKTLEALAKGHWLYVLNRLCYSLGYLQGRLLGISAKRR